MMKFAMMIWDKRGSVNLNVFLMDYLRLEIMYVGKHGSLINDKSTQPNES
jgi:hypothetical protein